jgi:hypothetical protein
MADFQLAVAVRDAMNDAFETNIGASAVLKIRTGAKPANVAAADSGTVLSTVALPADWMAASSGGTKAMAGTWQDLLADAAGTAGHFRIYASDGVTCKAQGSVTTTGGGGSMTVDNVVFAVDQPFNVTSFSITAGNA